MMDDGSLVLIHHAQRIGVRSNFRHAARTKPSRCAATRKMRLRFKQPGILHAHLMRIMRLRDGTTPHGALQ